MSQGAYDCPRDAERDAARELRQLHDLLRS
jgi:hypothetical protein